jgi:hypothetical protein
LQRSSRFGEDIVINASMSVEAIGGAIGSVDGETSTYNNNRPTTATHFYRLISHAGLDVSDVSNATTDMASALANVYNTIKHANRGDFPDAIHTIYAGRLALLLVRLALMKRLVSDGTAVVKFIDSWGVKKLFSDMKADGLSVDRSGHFVP